MASHQFVDRLAVQIDSLQEGFEVLSRASNVKDLARHFFHLLRGNYLTSDINIYFRPKHHKQWEQIYGKDDPHTEYLAENPETFELKSFGGKEPKVSVVQPLHDKSCIGIVLGKKMGGAAYSALDKISLQIFLQLFANAYQAHLQQRREKELNFSLNSRLLQLNSLIDTGIELTAQKQVIPPHVLALERAASLTNASWGRYRRKQGPNVLDKLVFPDGLRSHAVKDKGHRIHASFKFQGETFSFELFEKESRQGTVPFDETDKLLLEAIARQVHAVFESQFLHKQELEKQKIEQDISVAAAIQQRIIPKTLPVIEGYETFGVNIPTRFVGGDYYDCIPLSGGRYAFIMSDVAGKGVPAALLVSSFHASLSAFLDSNLSIVELAHKLNASMYRASTEERYITALIGILTPQTGQLEILNAGHNPAYVLRNDGSTQELLNGGLALGMLDMDFPYQGDMITLVSGDRLLFYTDGVTEAMDSQQRQYDQHRPILPFLAEHVQLNAEQFVRALIDDVRAFTGDAPQSDDITAMYLIRL